MAAAMMPPAMTAATATAVASTATATTVAAAAAAMTTTTPAVTTTTTPATAATTFGVGDRRAEGHQRDGNSGDKGLLQHRFQTSQLGAEAPVGSVQRGCLLGHGAIQRGRA
jgi:hypothetical protein